MSGWIGFELAVEYVERSLGLNHGAAWKALTEAGLTRSERGDVLDTDLMEWLNRPRAVGSKQPRIAKLLAEWFPNGVPEPGLCNRQQLANKLLDADTTLKPSIDMKTLKKTIDKYNRGVGKRS
jgi:hypothetical protein